MSKNQPNNGKSDNKFIIALDRKVNNLERTLSILNINIKKVLKELKSIKNKI